MKIEFRPQDLMIKDTNNGDEVVNIRSSLAFDPEFIAEMKANGVKKYIQQEETEEEIEE